MWHLGPFLNHLLEEIKILETPKGQFLPRTTKVPKDHTDRHVVIGSQFEVIRKHVFNELPNHMIGMDLRGLGLVVHTMMSAKSL